MIKASYMVAVAGLAVAQLAAAQQTDDPIDASFVQPYSASFDFYLYAEDGSRSVGGTWTDSVQIEGELLNRTVIRYDVDGTANMTRIILADRNTLIPELMDQRFGAGLSGIFRAEYDTDGVRQSLIASPTMRAQDVVVNFDTPVREISLWATLAMAVPFEAGRSFTVPVISENRREVQLVSVDVGASETVSAAGEEYQATRVTMPDNGWTFWLRKQPPYIVRIEHPGPNQTVAVSELTSFEQE